MLYPQLEQRLQASRQAMNRATSESIVKYCREFALLRGGNNSDLMTVQEAVDLASLLRREDHLAQTCPLGD